MRRVFWTIAIIVSLATANFEASQNLLFQLEPLSPPTSTSWVTNQNVYSETNPTISFTDYTQASTAVGRPIFINVKRFIPRVIKIGLDELIKARPFWSLIHSPKYPSEVNIG